MIGHLSSFVLTLLALSVPSLLVTAVYLAVTLGLTH
jgi:hypothetical protein